MSGTHGVFQHRSGYFYTILEEDFCEVYKAAGVNEVCRAYITTILEHLTNKQVEATGKESDIWVYMSLPEMARRMRHAFSERTIHKELQGMIKDGYLSKRRASGMATMEYKLNLRKIRKALEALPEIQSCRSATYDLANLQDQPGRSARSTLQNYKNDLADLQPRLPREETKEVPREEERASSQPTENARTLQSYNENDSYRHEDTQPHPASNCENWQGAHPGKNCRDYQAWIERGGREEPTDPDIPAVASASTPGTSGESPPSGESRHSSQGPDGGAAAVGSGSESRAPDAYAEKLRILDDWDKVNGQPEPRNRRLMAAAAALVPAHPTRDELQGCRDWLPKTDRPEKPWYALHGVGLWDIVEKLGLYRHHLALSIEPAPLADVPKPKPLSIYAANSMDKEKMDRRIAEMKARVAAKGKQLPGGLSHGTN